MGRHKNKCCSMCGKEFINGLTSDKGKCKSCTTIYNKLKKREQRDRDYNLLLVMSNNIRPLWRRK